MDHPDAVVIGGGPAGCAAAIALKEHAPGRDVVLLERKHEPMGKRPLRSGEVLFAGHRRALARIGITVDGAPWALHDVTRFRVVLPNGREHHATRPWGKRLVEIARDSFDHALRARAAEAGVDVRTGHRVTDVRIEGDRVTHVTARDPDGEVALAPRWLVDAGGRFAVVPRKLDLVGSPDPRHPDANHAVFTAWYRDFPQERDLWEIFFLPGASTVEVSTPVPGLTRLGTGVPMDRVRGAGKPAEDLLTDVITGSPELEARVAESRGLEYAWNVAPVAYRVRPPGLRNVLLPGDARGYLSPFYGDGTLIALESGHAAGRLVAEEARGQGGNAAARFERDVMRPLLRKDWVRAQALRVFEWPRAVDAVFRSGAWKLALRAQTR